MAVTDRAIADASGRATDLAIRGAVREGYELLQQAIAAGDGLAAATLGDWRLGGGFIRRDLTEARRLYGQAFTLGVKEAAEPYGALLASGAGGSDRDWTGALDCLAERAP